MKTTPMQRRPRFETLEEKNLFAVIAEVSDGVLEITGDHSNDDITVSRNDDWILINGNDTSVNRSGFRIEGGTNLNEPFHSIKIDMGNGSDSLLVRDLYLDGSLNIISGQGRDDVEVRDSNLSSINIQEETNSSWSATPYSTASLKLENVRVGSSLFAQSTWIDADNLTTNRNGAVILKGAFVDANSVVANGVVVYNDAGTSLSDIDLSGITAQTLTVDTSNGNDTVRLASSSIALNARIDTGTSGFSGYDRIYVSGTTVGYDLTIDTGQGTDKQGSYTNLSSNYVRDDLRIITGAGNDTVVMSNSTVGDLMSVATRAGDDTAVVIGSTIRDDLSLNMGDGDDYFNLFRSRVTDSLSASMGRDDDTLRISGSTVGRAYVKGESGSQDYLQLVDAVFGQLSPTGFERFFFS